MNNMVQAVQIAIIGGADGPTAIYISSESTWFYVAVCVLLFALSIFLIFRLVKNIREKKCVRAIICAVFCLPCAIIPVGILFMNVASKLYAKEFSKMLEDYKMDEYKTDVPEISQNTFWSENEIVGTTFELISDSQVEEFSFFIDYYNGTHGATCTFGEKGGWITAPAEYWSIDENGVLLVYPDENKPSKDCIKLQKREIDAENGIAYLLRNGEPKVYFYKGTKIGAE